MKRFFIMNKKNIKNYLFLFLSSLFFYKNAFSAELTEVANSGFISQVVQQSTLSKKMVDDVSHRDADAIAFNDTMIRHVESFDINQRLVLNDTLADLNQLENQ